MLRKLYALFILIGAIGALVLAYLYFFVYYTSTLVVNTNVTEYNVELFSKSTAQKWTFSCPDMICELPNISPFEYNITLSKNGYVPQVISAKVSPRTKEEFIIQLEKKVELTAVELIETTETTQEKILRIKDENQYYAVFQVDETTKILFQEDGDVLDIILEVGENKDSVFSFPKINKELLNAQRITQSGNIFLDLGGKYFIFEIGNKKMREIPIDIPLLYIKKGNITGEYLLVTEKGTFLYNIITQALEFQYLFRDFVFFDEYIIGIIYSDEIQKKSNFNLTEKGNLIIKYSSKTKERKIIYTTQEDIKRIEWQNDKIMLEVGEKQYELQNFE